MAITSVAAVEREGRRLHRPDRGGGPLRPRGLQQAHQRLVGRRDSPPGPPRPACPGIPAAEPAAASAAPPLRPPRCRLPCRQPPRRRRCVPAACRAPRVRRRGRGPAGRRVAAEAEPTRGRGARERDRALARGGHGVHRVGGRAEEGRRHGGHERRGRHHTAPAGQEQQRRPDHADRDDRPTAATGTNSGVRPSSTHAHAAVPTTSAGQRPPRARGRPTLPQQRPADADQRGDTRRERHRVVLVEDPFHQGEHQRRHHRPAAPHDQRSAQAVGAGRPSGQHDPDHEQRQRRGQQPGDLAADVVREQPAQPGVAPNGPPPPPPKPPGPPGKPPAASAAPPPGTPAGRCLPRRRERLPFPAAPAAPPRPPPKPPGRRSGPARCSRGRARWRCCRSTRRCRAGRPRATARPRRTTSRRRPPSRAPRRAAAAPGATGPSAPPTGTPPPARAARAAPARSW